jgi:hypothetical protein
MMKRIVFYLLLILAAGMFTFIGCGGDPASHSDGSDGDSDSDSD